MNAKKVVKARKKLAIKRQPKSERSGSAITSLDQPGMLPVLMALASSVRGVNVSTLKAGAPRRGGAGVHSGDVAFETTPPDLPKLRLNDRRVGITSAAQIAILRSNLAHLLPHIAADVATIPLKPTSIVSDAADLVGHLLARTPQPAIAPTVFALGSIGEARKRVENRWGKVFASKSSP